MKQAYIIIDMQNDFIDGALGTAEAPLIVQRIRDKIIQAKQDDLNPTDLIFTQDTHGQDYLETQEGRKLPVPHCIVDTKGWNICQALLPFTLDATVLKSPPSAARIWSKPSKTMIRCSSWACAQTSASFPMPCS